LQIVSDSHEALIRQDAFRVKPGCFQAEARRNSVAL
jgi:hypothetical protein